MVPVACPDTLIPGNTWRSRFNFILLLCLSSLVAAGETAPTWDWFPRAADDDRICSLYLTASTAWTASPQPGLTTRRTGDQLVLSFVPNTLTSLRVEGSGRHSITVRIIAPNHAEQLTLDDHGRLLVGQDLAVLAVPRREAIADRRWGALRVFSNERPEVCGLVLAEPHDYTLGMPVLMRQIVAAQQLKPAGKSVLIQLSGDDRLAAWKHREYRQALAWMIGDLAARGATRIVLLEPSCPAVEEATLAPLRTQVHDVAAAYLCTTIDAKPLSHHRWWEVQPGVLGTQLNPAGIAERSRLLRPWLGGSN
ncbi:MAG: hypothetical protein AAB263_04330 [Planctomycetota bacterium]